MNNTEVLIVGAGPSGLVMAAELARHGVCCRIIEKNAAISSQSKALGIHARSLEMFADMGMIEPVLAHGNKIHSLNIYSNRKQIVHVDLQHLATPYPFVLALPQNNTEEILQAHCEKLGVSVEHQTEIADLAQTADHVQVTLRKANGESEQLTVQYVVGCDGAHSKVRELLQLKFIGNPYSEVWLNGDIYGEWDYPTDQAYACYRGKGIMAVFPINKNRFRLITNHYHRRHGEQPHTPTVVDFQTIANIYLPTPMKLGEALWLNEFSIHFRSVKTNRVERVMLAGDAAHIHSPAGGQGMNTGMQDAYNLAWKLALVCRNQAKTKLLHSYQQERMAVAKDVIVLTNRLTRLMTMSNPLFCKFRDWFLLTISKLPAMQQRFAKSMAELDISYRQSDLTAEHAGGRAPAAQLKLFTSGEPISLFNIIAGTTFSLLLFSGVKHSAADLETLTNIAEAVQARYGEQIKLHWIISTQQKPTKLQSTNEIYLDPKQQCHQIYKADTACLYLIRPDGYISYHAKSPQWSALQAYLQSIFE